MILTLTHTILAGGITPILVGEKQPNHLEEALIKMTFNTNTFIEETRSNFKNQGKDTEVNPNGECKATILRNGKVLGDNSELKSDKHAEDKTVEDSPVKSATDESAQAQPKSPSSSSLVKGKEKQIPFPQRFQKKAKDQHFSKFLEIFKKL
ncbi:hypothetical protein PIB30_081078 [Stylosanthes scabra]|uniref:Uncharacterized protein n=1 Tax=Stylosanthes scabra TaxID=79078 RepID=A0ABU6UQE2_9FABA|nr:hypothetical protein [Stylosanthes scabra]